MAQSLDHGGARDFDFLIGRWSVRHRKLRERLRGSDEWFEFPGTLHVVPILGGLGNVDDNELFDPDGEYVATSLRVFRPADGKWSVYWIDGRSPGIAARMRTITVRGSTDRASLIAAILSSPDF